MNFQTEIMLQTYFEFTNKIIQTYLDLYKISLLFLSVIDFRIQDTKSFFVVMVIKFSKPIRVVS